MMASNSTACSDHDENHLSTEAVVRCRQSRLPEVKLAARLHGQHFQTCKVRGTIVSPAGRQELSVMILTRRLATNEDDLLSRHGTNALSVFQLITRPPLFGRLYQRTLS